MFAKRNSTPAPSSRRQSMAQRLSVTFGLAISREAFTIEEAKSPQATDIALRIANKDPNKPCLNDVGFCHGYALTDCRLLSTANQD